MRRTILRGLVAIIGFTAILSAGLVSAETSYRQSIEQWRQNYEAGLTSDTGWLTVSGLFWLREGENRLGSAAGNDIVLPSSAPAYVGTLEFHGSKITVQVNPGVKVMLNGKPIQTAELKPDTRQYYLVLGDLTLYVHASGDRLALRVKDKNSALRKNFTGLNWFPIDGSYAVTGTYVPFESPKEVDSENVLGDAIKLRITGYVAFSLQGQEYRLDGGLDRSGKNLFIVFRDWTSGKQTYPASRFLDVELPAEATKSGRVVVDFNKSYNPPCAYNPYTTCPLPVPGNRLKIEIPVGEKLYKHDHGS
jgi:uncharacterized protein (DUF1684 family)